MEKMKALHKPPDFLWEEGPVLFVEIQLDGMKKPILCTPEEAKAHALKIWEIAEKAEKRNREMETKNRLRRCSACGQVVTSGTCRPGYCSRRRSI